MKKQDLSISNSKWEVLKIFWEDSPLVLPQILQKLEHTGWSVTTIQTFLSRLVKKSILKTQRQGKGFLCSPVVTEQECQISESKEFLNRVFDGSVNNLVTSFIKSCNLSENELTQLKTLISKYGGNKNEPH